MKMSMKHLKSWMTDHPYPRTLATIGGASICSMLALELPSNHELWKMRPEPALLELLLIFCFLCLLFYLPHRRKTPAIVGFACQHRYRRVLRNHVQIDAHPTRRPVRPLDRCDGRRQLHL